jgi:hypothetical protein
MTKFYDDEDDPPRMQKKPEARYYTMSELERAYVDSIKYIEVLEEELRACNQPK